MISASQAYTDALAQPGRARIFGLHITQDSVSPTEDYYFATERIPTAAAFEGALELLRPIEMVRRGDPRESRYVASTLTIELPDMNGAVTDYITANALGLNNGVATFSSFLRGLDWDGGDAVTLFKGRVHRLEYRDGVYRVVVRSATAGAMLNTRLFDGVKTTLNTGINDTDTSLIADSPGFQDTGMLVIGTERISWTGTTDNGDGTMTLTGLTRGVGPSSPAAHTAGDTIREVFSFGYGVVTAHPVDVLNTALTRTERKDGLSIAATWVDTASLTSAKLSIGEGSPPFYDNFYFEGTKGRNAKTFIEDEFFRTTASYPIENNEGQLGLAFFDTPAANDFVDTIEDVDVVGVPRNNGAFELQVNHVLFDYDAEIVNFDGSFLSQHEQLDQSLIDAYGRHTLHIQSNGLRGNATTQPWLNFLPERTQSYIDRFGSPVPLLSFVTPMSKELLEVADLIYCTFSNVLDLAGGDRDIDAGEFEIIGVRHQYALGRIEFDVLGYP